VNKPNKIIFGCLGSLLIFILLSWAALTWVKNKTISIIADTTHEVVNTGITQSHLPSNQKQAFLSASDSLFNAVSSGEIGLNFDGSFQNPEKATDLICSTIKSSFTQLEVDTQQQKNFNHQLDRLRNSYLNKQISEEELVQIIETLSQGPFGLSLTVWAIHSSYIRPSNLSEEEKLKAQVLLKQLVNGLNEAVLKLEEVEKITAPYKKTNAQGQSSLKENLSDSEIRTLLKEIEQLLKERNVPTVKGSINIPHELKVAFDAAGLPE
jgi:hypothetical protein